MADGQRNKTTAFRAMIVGIFKQLVGDEANDLAIVYEEENCPRNTLLAKELMDKGLIKNDTESLTAFKKSLAGIHRDDLIEKVDNHIKQDLPPPVMPARAVSEPATVIDQGIAIGGIAPSSSAVKMKTLVDPNLEDGISSDASPVYENDPLIDHLIKTGSLDDVVIRGECSPKDKECLQKAVDAAKNSEDTSTKVGAVIVNAKDYKILGTGWNRMPWKCDEKFSWDREGALEAGKHLYVVYGVRAAILDALKCIDSLEGTILYTTLNPGNVCAQMIVDVGIKEVVYISDKFHDKSFMEASRKILALTKCRQIQIARK